MTADEAHRDAQDHLRLVHGGQDIPGAYVECGDHVLDLLMPAPPPANPTTGRRPDCPDDGDPEFLCATTTSRWFPVKVGLVDALNMACFAGVIAALVDSLLALFTR